MTVSATDWVGVALSGGRYRITSKLGEGGMALVYRAWDENVGHDVVVKVPRRSMMDDPGFAERFKDEIRSLIKLPHPHIVKVFDLGEHDGLPFAVMQFLSGGSLEDRIYDLYNCDAKPRPMSPASLAEWLPQVAKALQFVHGENYVHRDVKPANILFDAQGNAYLSDFGVHKALAGSQTRAKVNTGTGMVLGTPHYMAPELAQGEVVDGRIDQYALAVTVHEALSGQKPFDGPTGLAILFAHVNQPPPRLDAVVPGIPRALAEAVLRGLQKDPAHRFKTCSAFADAVLADVGGARAQQPGKAQPARDAGGTAALSPLAPSQQVSAPASPALQGTQALRPAGGTMAMAGVAPAPVAQPIAQPGAGSSPSSTKGRPRSQAITWLKIVVAASSPVVILMGALSFLSFSRGGKKTGDVAPVSPASATKTDDVAQVSPPAATKTEPVTKPEPATNVPGHPAPDPKLTEMVAEWNRLAAEFAARLPRPVSFMLKRLEYTNEAELRRLLERSEADRQELASDARLEELHKLAQEIMTRARAESRGDVAVQGRLEWIDSQLKTSDADSPQAKAELETLGELDHILRSWQPVAMTQAARARANEYIAQRENGALHFLGACALLRDNSLPAAMRGEMLRNWEAVYSEQQRAAICLALIQSGSHDLVDEALGRINREPRLLGMYDPADLFAEIEQHRPQWEAARETLANYFAGPLADRLASALGQAPQSPSPKDKKSSTASRGPQPSPAGSGPPVSKPAFPEQWVSPILLPGGLSLAPDSVNLEAVELSKIDVDMPETAYSYKNPKSPQGELLVHSAYSVKKGDSLNLDGWTIARHENGSPKLAVQFDNDDRKGPLRFWDADGKLRLYANYTNDRLHGPACFFENGMPTIVMNYVGNQLKGKYLVDYESGRPVARAVDELPPELVQAFAAKEKQFSELSDDIKQQETEFKKKLKKAFEDYQRQARAERSKYLRAKNKANEDMNRAEYEAGVARTIGTLVIAGGGMF